MQRAHEPRAAIEIPQRRALEFGQQALAALAPRQLGAAVIRREHSRTPIERIDFQPRIVGQDVGRPPGALQLGVQRARLHCRVVGIRRVALDRVFVVAVRSQRKGRVGEERFHLAQLAEIRRRDVDLHPSHSTPAARTRRAAAPP